MGASLPCGFSLRWLLSWSKKRACGFSSRGAWAWLLPGTWVLPGPGIKPVSPALAGIFFSFFFLINSFFNRRIIALQNFIGFCQASTWISHRYTYITSLLNFPPISLLIPHLQVDREPLFRFPGPDSKLFYIWLCKFPCYSFHTSHPLLPSPQAGIFLITIPPGKS